MNDALYRINYVSLKNKNLKLKKESKDKEKKIIEFSDECKKIINIRQNNSISKINEMSDIIASLKSENERLYKENDLYKESFKKIPIFILRFFKINLDTKLRMGMNFNDEKSNK